MGADGLAPLLLPAALLVVVQLNFSLYSVLGSAAFHSGTSPIVFALLRDVVACCCFVPALLLEARQARASPLRLVPRAEHALHFFALAATGVWGSQLMSALAIANLSAPIYGLVKPCVPVVTLAVAVAAGQHAFNLRTRASQLVVLGVLAAVGGAAFIVAASYVDRESANALLGAGYLGLYMCANGSYPIVQKHVLSTLDYSPLLVTTWTYLVGTLLILMSAVTAAPPAAEWALTPTGTAGVLFSGVLSTFFNYSAMTWVNQRTTGVFVSSFFPLQSFLTPLLAALTLGARIFPADYAGGVVIMFGLGCCTAAQLLQQQQQQQQEDREEEEEGVGGGARQALVGSR